MCKNVEAVLEQGVDMPTKCEVTMDGVTHASDDFVCVLSRENGDASIFYNTDALTMGMTMKMVAKSFVDMMAQLTEEERISVQEILGDAFVAPKEATENE